MGGKLTNKDMDVLEQYIGTGPKVFTLLYAITRDGCNAQTFHHKCDNQGATVTVLYNPQGSVYGGYASASWNIAGQWINTSDSFIFRLHFNGSQQATKFPPRLNMGIYSLLGRRQNGPIFGHDLCCFSGTIPKSGNSFPLNGQMNVGNTYDNKGLQATDINNGTMNVIELEVYKVADGVRQRTPDKSAPKTTKTWRKTKAWNEQFLDELREQVVSFKPIEDVKIQEARILLLGPAGAGKSSFYNTLDAVFRGRITHRACSGSAEQSLTTTYTPYRLRVKSGASLNFRLCDTRGLEESSGLSDVECNYLLDGHIPDYYQFNPTICISTKTPGFNQEPTRSDQIHCVVFVLDASTLDVVPEKLVAKMKGFQSIINQKGIPQLIILTKIDKLCKDVANDVSKVFNSAAVEEHVEKAGQLLGLPRSNVLPVKNYESEDDVDDNINILALLALRRILNFTEDFMYNICEKNQDLQRQLDKVKLEK